MIYVDNTILVSFATCETKGVLRHILGRSGETDSAALHFGTALHQAFAASLREESPTHAFAEFERSYRAWAEDNIFDPANARSWTNASALIAYYLLTHAPDSLPYDIVRDRSGIPIVEYPMEYGLADGITYVGTLDALVRDKNTGLVYVLDHKTTSYDATPYYERQFVMGSQLSGYLWLGQKLVEKLSLDEPITGALINAVHVRPIPTSPRRCPVHGMPYSQCGIQHLEAQLLGPYIRTQAQIAQWEQQAKDLAWRYRRQHDEAKVTGNTSLEAAWQEGLFNNACQNCEFIDFCRQGRPWNSVENLYALNPWQPWVDRKPDTTSAPHR
jgi:PD-(D/E)XK nuclease superfamily